VVEVSVPLNTASAERSREEPFQHPNASVALGSGAGLGSIRIWGGGFTGLAMPPEVGAAFGGLIASAFLFVGRRGLRDTLRSLWNGSD
jgi:hypothetical protein